MPLYSEPELTSQQERVLVDRLKELMKDEEHNEEDIAYQICDEIILGRLRKHFPTWTVIDAGCLAIEGSIDYFFEKAEEELEQED